MAFEVEKHGKIVAIIETIITILVGVGCLAGIIVMIVMASYVNGTDPQPTPPVPTPKWTESYNSYETRIRVGRSTTSSAGGSVAVGLAIGLSFLFVAIFLVSLFLLILLWKGVNHKDSGKCTGWYITQSIFCGLDMLAFVFSFTAGFPIYAYLIKVVYYCYRVYSIHVIRSYSDIFTGSSILH